MEEIKTKNFGRKMRNHQKVLEEQKEHLQLYLRHNTYEYRLQTNQSYNYRLRLLLPKLIEPWDPDDFEWYRLSNQCYTTWRIVRLASFYFSRQISAKLAPN